MLLQDSDDEDDEKAGMKGVQVTHSRASGRLLDQSRETLMPKFAVWGSGAQLLTALLLQDSVDEDDEMRKL